MGASASVSKTPERDAGRRAVRPLRVGGYLLYDAWLLSSFYNTFLYLATPDFRSALYQSTLESLVALAATVLLFPRLASRPDKRVLSLRCCVGAGTGLALFTLLVTLADGSTPVGAALLHVCAVGTGLCSGLLFLGWSRLYADIGTRAALIETSAAWAGAGLLCCALSQAPVPLAQGCAVTFGLVSALVLRRCAFSRPTRPRPAHTHQLQRRTRRMFVRGLVACCGVGVVAGFSDVIAGFRYLPVPDHYEVYLALSCAAVALVLLAIGSASRRDFVTHAYRAVTLLLMAGCLLTPFISVTATLSNVVVFGAYIGFTVLLCVVCIDVSNYFDQPATHTFGMAFFCLYLGEIGGNGLAHALGGVMERDASTLSLITLFLGMGIAVANLFLFTEKDLTETSLGEMTDDDAPGTAGAAWMPAAGDGGAGAPWIVGAGAQRGARAAADADPIGCAACAEASHCPNAPVGLGGSRQPGGRVTDVERVCSLLVGRYGLTPRESEVLPLVVQGRTIARIQEELHISQGTVSTHIRHIYQKADVRNRQGLLDLVEELEGERK